MLRSGDSITTRHGRAGRRAWVNRDNRQTVHLFVDGLPVWRL